ncbi:major facilitator superfamily domain-containing protein [Aspergillus pseudotamarii]|uniref:Major facilitator superfamily domain-containing protein n=1 Tax=Aspergillus pseudotamarii TaxID=132259 RepID=A0A5N6SI09_ASPPS|nr:major facilitator superfamily domain-containing protein [Aspergillus pseudotamarii]KAE8133529.1 major facilitator superfamily domain-containing protein [Aspergillus pseudotamarii]
MATNNIHCSGDGTTAVVNMQVDIVPEADVLRDAEDRHLKHGRGTDTVLIPQPSNNSDNPLNWAPAWKFESSLSMANFLIVPFSNNFGRRLTSISLGVLTFLTVLWEVLATSHKAFLAARVVNGLTTATTESIMMQVIADMFFLHERGLWTGIYFTSYFVGLLLGPVIAGNIAENFFWLSLGLAAFNIVTLVVFFPRQNTGVQGRPSERKTEAIDEPTPITNTEKHDANETIQASNDTEATDSNSQTSKGRPSKNQFKLFQKPDPCWKGFLIRDILSPIRAFFYPNIFWAGLNVAGPANLLLFFNLTESAVLAAPSYNFSSGAVGYSNFAFFVGGTIGLLTAGPFSDWVADQATRRNRGIREAQMRLPALIPFFITTAIGNIIKGLGYQRQWSWPIILVFGYGLTGLSVTTVPTIAVAYAVDCYKPMSGEIMVVATVIKNTIGFSMSYWFTPLGARKSLIAPAMVEFALTMGPMLLAVPLYFCGRRLRRFTRNSTFHQWSEM